MNFFPERGKEIIKIGISFASPIILVLSVIANSITVLERFKDIIMILTVISALFVLGLAVYYVVFTAKAGEKNIKIGILEKEICKGNKYILNEATVTMDIDQKKYIIEIKKEYEIISESIKWFECQFYCNNILTNASEALANYDNNPVKWEELNIRASLQYKNPEDTDYYPPKYVRVKRVAEGNNYKQFHIEYKTEKGDPLDVKEGTRIILTYKYEVPVTKWGSYLNRYVTYWGEATKVSIACKDEQKLRKNELKLYKTNRNGCPVIDPKSNQWNDTIINDLYYRELKIDPTRCCKYIVSWNANEFFNIENIDLNTQIGEDQSQLTQY